MGCASSTPVVIADPAKPEELKPIAAEEAPVLRSAPPTANVIVPPAEVVATEEEKPVAKPSTAVMVAEPVAAVVEPAAEVVAPEVVAAEVVAAKRQLHPDLVVVTDDNPRDEDPVAIRAAIITGARGESGGADIIEIGDRRSAISHAVAWARRGDVVVIAGKGHETGQTSGGHTRPFDDRDELGRALESRIDTA
jgi:hypothetical protein